MIVILLFVITLLIGLLFPLVILSDFYFAGQTTGKNPAVPKYYRLYAKITRQTLIRMTCFEGNYHYAFASNGIAYWKKYGFRGKGSNTIGYPLCLGLKSKILVKNQSFGSWLRYWEEIK